MPNYFNTSLKNLVYRLRRYNQILTQELKNEVLEHEDVIIEMVQQQLYDQGITGQGVEIASYAPYKPRTIRYKQKKGQPIDRVTLRDTGEFYKSMHVVFDERGFYVTSTNDKTKHLVKKYGETIFRLTNENLKILLRDYIRPSLKEKLINYLKNG